MCILCIQLYIYRMIFPDRSRRKNRQGEQGIIGVFVLCLMMLVMLMGTGLLYVIRQGAQEGEDYRRASPGCGESGGTRSLPDCSTGGPGRWTDGKRTDPHFGGMPSGMGRLLP